MLPLAYSLAAGQIGALELDARQTWEVLLTSAQSIFALVVIASFSFSLMEASLLLGLFMVQLFFPSPEFRFWYSLVYIALAVGMALLIRQNRVSLLLGMLPRMRRPLRRHLSGKKKSALHRRAMGV
jgi:cation:H+ antiporter